MKNRPSPLAANDRAGVLGTIGRWLLAAGLALAAMHPGDAFAQPAGPDGLTLDLPAGPHPHPAEVLPFFTKKGAQRDCDHVIYELRFGARGDPSRFLDPLFIAGLKSLRMDFRDQLPAGLKVVGIEASGDGTDAAGGPLPEGTTGTTLTPDDTAELVDFRLSAADLDGAGAINERVIDIRITARIDHAAFAAPALVDNQGVVTIAVPGAPGLPIFSHEPNVPDDADFLTGAPTSIGVDVTGCRPPPLPPVGEPCFDVAASGEVDCAPGGAFTWHMPAGPDLAGKWVQIGTTAPDITIAPAMQLVPAGGGVLDWTITGASPGDAVHLVVTGIESHGGPQEGVGLCCTQTLDIVIPADLDCPDGEGGPDLEVEHAAFAAQCAGALCDFTIRVTNVGDSPYQGPIVLDELTAPGSAPVVSGPNAPWACRPMASPMSCTHPTTTLDPGEWTELKLGLAPGPGREAGYIRHCAAYDYAASGRQPFGNPHNDRHCATIPNCVPGRDRECSAPAPSLVDLRIAKQPRAAACTADGACSFVMRVFNTGTGTYEGPLTVVDSYPTGAPASSDFGPAPPWSCVPADPGTFRCEHPGLALPPGGSVGLAVRATVPDGYGEAFIRNCGEVIAIGGELDLANNRACAAMRLPRVPGRPDLRIAKSCENSVGPAVSCRVTVTNSGDTAPLGPVRVADAATLVGTGTPVEIAAVTPDGAEWTCGPVPADSLACRIPGELLAAGASRHFDVTVVAPPTGRLENCARGSFGPAPGDDVVRPFGEACAESASAAIRVEKTGDRECRAGRPCTFEITIANDGAGGFSGPVRIGDAVGLDGIGRLEGVPIASIEPPFGCSPAPATLPISCLADLTLAAGESRVHRVTVTIPDDARLSGISGPVDGRNCIGVLPPGTPVAGGGGMEPPPLPDGASGPGNYACHPFTLLKEVRQECAAGFVLNAERRCVCPEGATFRNGQCRDRAVSDPGPAGQCRLLPGQIRTAAGQCVCPARSELRNGRCVVVEEPEQCRLLPGQVRTSDERCVCPRGTELSKGRCIRDEPPQCRLLQGQIRTSDGRCVCPRGTELRGGRCVRGEPPQCRLLQGQIRTSDGRCACPRGTQLVRGACRQQAATPDCPQGTRLVRGRCVRSGGQAPALRIDPNLLERALPRRLPPRTNLQRRQ